MTVVKDVEDGVATHVDARMKRGKVEFDAYHLRKTVYEMSAREDGLEGSLNDRWMVRKVMGIFWKACAEPLGRII